MSFASPPFVFLLAFTLFVFSLASERHRLYVLIALNLIWYGSWNLTWPAIILAIAAVNFVAKGRSVAMLIFLDVAGLVAFKVFGAPFGISFFFLLLLGLLIDSRRSNGQGEPRTFLEFFAFLSLFPLLASGPIERFRRLGPQLRELGPLRRENLLNGSMIFSYGYLKKVHIGNALAAPVSALLNPSVLSLKGLLLGGLLATFRAYVDFSSYCDMGRGAARCFGIELLPNFRPFYYARNPVEFWQRWNITLGTWIRDYLTLPAMLRFGRKLNVQVIVLVSFLFVGLWHGISINWLAFGLFNGALIAVFQVAQGGGLLNHPGASRGLGLVLVLLLFIGNGILQNSDAMTLLAEAFQSHSDPVLPVIPVSAILSVFAMLGVDYFQEQKKDLDFYIQFPLVLRLLLVVGFLGWFLTTLETEAARVSPEPPPAYFRF